MDATVRNEFDSSVKGLFQNLFYAKNRPGSNLKPLRYLKCFMYNLIVSVHYILRLLLSFIGASRPKQ